MIESKDISYIGRFGKPHGYRGEINLSFTQFDDEKFLEEEFPVILNVDGIYVPFFIRRWRRKGEDFLVYIDGFNSDREVKQFANSDVYGMRSDIDSVYEDFAHDEEGSLIGMTVIDARSGQPIGEITNYDSATANELIEVLTPAGTTITLPLHDDFIEGMDFEDLTITLRYPEGLVEAMSEV